MLGLCASSCRWLAKSKHVMRVMESKKFQFLAIASSAGGTFTCILAQQHFALNFPLPVAGVGFYLKASGMLEMAARSCRLFLNPQQPVLAFMMEFLQFFAFFVGSALIFLVAGSIPGWMGWCMAFYACVRVISSLLDWFCPDVMQLVSDGGKPMFWSDVVDVVSSSLLALMAWSVLNPSSFFHYTKPAQALMELHFFLKETKML